jgi:hypothetical protein
LSLKKHLAALLQDKAVDGLSIAEAVSKIKTEMDQNKSNSYVQVVGNFLIEHLGKHPGDAVKVIADGKSIIKSLDEMREVASKSKVNNCGLITPQDGFNIVMKYYGISLKDAVLGVDFASGQSKTVHHEVQIRPKSKVVDFDVSLNDLL